MSTTTEKYGFLKPDPNDFYDVKEDISDNMDKVEEALSEFDDSGSVEEIKNFPDFLSKFLSGNKLATTLRNLKAGLQFVLHTGQIVNNCVTDNAGLPLSAAQGKALMDKYTQLYSDSQALANNLSDSRKVVQVTTDDHGFSLGYDADNGLYTLVDLTRFYLVSKADLTKSIDFRGNAKMFKVRSGTDGLKNIYLDIEDESGNTCSLAFLSDGENTVKLMLNGKTVWTK